MGATPWNGSSNGPGEQPEVDPSSGVSPEVRPSNDAIRSWLVRGVHTFGFDPRRLGGRGHARRLLGEDRRLAPGAVGAWRELVSALQRHTIHSAIHQLSDEERQVVTLAYLQGRTNRQIAAILGVSVSTARRRLWLALQHLDEYVRRTGTWVSSVLLIGLALASGWAARFGRWVNTAASADWPHKLAATVAVGTVATAGIGLAIADHRSEVGRHHSVPAVTSLTPDQAATGRTTLAQVIPANPDVSHNAGTTTQTTLQDSAPTKTTKDVQQQTVNQQSAAKTGKGHHGKSDDGAPSGEDPQESGEHHTSSGGET